MEDVETDSEDHCYDRDRYFFMSRPSPMYEKKEKPKSQIQSYKARLGKTRGIEDTYEDGGIGDTDF